MAKPPQSKGNTKRKADNSHHGTTFCKNCFKKIARGMNYCNRKCREATINANKDG